MPAGCAGSRRGSPVAGVVSVIVVAGRLLSIIDIGGDSVHVVDPPAGGVMLIEQIGSVGRDVAGAEELFALGAGWLRLKIEQKIGQAVGNRRLEKEGAGEKGGGRSEKKMARKEKANHK